MQKKVQTKNKKETKKRLSILRLPPCGESRAMKPKYIKYFSGKGT